MCNVEPRRALEQRGPAFAIYGKCLEQCLAPQEAEQGVRHTLCFSQTFGHAPIRCSVPQDADL